jgi:hypothetical protein
MAAKRVLRDEESLAVSAAAAAAARDARPGEEDEERKAAKQPRSLSIFESAASFAARVDRELASDEFKFLEPDALNAACSTHPPTLATLPRLFEAMYQQKRFYFSGGRLSCVLRLPMAEVLERIIAGVDDETLSGLSVHGVQGAGKSYSLYAVVCALRRLRGRFRVTYIADCDAWTRQGVLETLLALVTTFYADEETSVVERAAVILEMQDKNLAMSALERLVFDLSLWAGNAKLPWVLVVDQINRIRSKEKQNEYPFSLAQDFGGRDALGVRFCVTSASANNEFLASDARQNQLRYDFLPFQRFSDEEFTLLADKHRIPAELHERVACLTGRLPLDVNLLLHAPGLDWERKIAAYREARLAEMNRIHDRFIKAANKEGNRKDVDDAVARMLLRVPVKQETFGDQQLTYLEPAAPPLGPGYKFIKPITPLALETIEELHKQIDGNVKTVTEIVLSDPDSFTNAVKGKVLEGYLIRSFAKQRHVHFSYKALGARKEKEVVLEFDLPQVISFAGQRVPESFAALPLPASFEPARAALIYPESETFPDIDLLLWVPEPHATHEGKADCVLYALQVTLAKPLSGHLDSQQSFESRQREAWRALIPTAKRVEFLFVADNAELGNARMPTLVCDFTRNTNPLRDFLPVLKSFRRKV